MEVMCSCSPQESNSTQRNLTTTVSPLLLQPEESSESPQREELPGLDCCCGCCPWHLRARPLSAASKCETKLYNQRQPCRAGGKTSRKGEAVIPPLPTHTGMETGWRQEMAFLALVLWASGTSQEGAAVFGADFNSKADRLLTEDPSNPKCFSQHLEDLACFWETPGPPRKGENQTTYTFLYKFEEERSLKSCKLDVVPTARNTTRYVCIFQRQDIAAFTPIEVKVLKADSTNSSLYSRTIWLDKVVFLDPPSNLTVRLMEMPGQVNVSWRAPNLAFLGTSIRYEVNISLEGSKSQRVEIANGRTYCLITNLKGQARYTLVVRAKPDGVSYDGYWSTWSQPVTMTTINNLDPLILTLSVILVMIVLLLAFIALMSHRRFLKKKIWPEIPTPEREFKDLFTIYKGNFQLWLGHQSTYPWWSYHSFYLEEQPFLLEILSDRESRKVDYPPPLPPKARDLVALPHPPDVSQDEYLVLDEDVAPHGPARDGAPLSKEGATGESPDVALPAAAGTRESSQASSSFEYTVFDPSSESLSPRDRQAEPQRKGSYQMVSDSGISADYSPVGSNGGQASLYTNLCDGGIQPQAFMPAYIMCS